MGKIRTGLKVLVYIMAILVYILLPVFFDFRGNIILSLILSVVLIFNIIKIIRDIVKGKSGVKIKSILLCTLNLIFIGIVGIMTITVIDIYREEDKSIALYSILEKTEVEPEGYNDAFKKQENDNYKILYTEKLELGLGCIDLILDEAIKVNNRIFGDFNKSKVTIKFDYIEEVFKNRYSSETLGGLYLPHTKEIYVYGKDAYDDVLAFGGMIKIDASLTHEYTHHIMFEYFKENGIDPLSIPLWFIEGVAQYVSDGPMIGDINKIVSLNKLSTNEEWEKNLKLKNSIYSQSQYAISKLVVLKGEDKIKDIILKSKNSDFNTAFTEVVGISIEDFDVIMNKDFEDGFKNYLIEVQEIQKNRKENNDNYSYRYKENKMKSLEKYLLIENKVMAYAALADLYNMRSEYDKSEKILKKGIEKNPKESYLYNLLGNVYKEKKEFKLADECFKKAESFSKE